MGSLGAIRSLAHIGWSVGRWSTEEAVQQCCFGAAGLHTPAVQLGAECLRGQKAVTLGLLLSGVSLRTVCLDLLGLCILQLEDRRLKLLRRSALDVDETPALQLATN